MINNSGDKATRLFYSVLSDPQFSLAACSLAAQILSLADEFPSDQHDSADIDTYGQS
jgi:hypothetical protein